LSQTCIVQSILLWLFLEMGFSWTICPGWPWIVILPISASEVAEMTGMSHQHLAQVSSLKWTVKLLIDTTANRSFIPLTLQGEYINERQVSPLSEFIRFFLVHFTCL
jgi:hypothetical protein